MAEGIEPGEIVGRGRELARLEAAFDGIAAVPPVGRTIVVGGEAGIGKSRHRRGALADSARARGTTVLIGACLPTGSGAVPYAPFVEALRELVRSVDAGLVPALLGPARAEIERLLPEFGGRVTASAPEAPRPTGRDRAVCSRRSERSWSAAGATAPVVLVIEDVQWADDGTRALVAFLSRNLRQQPC